MIRRLASTGGGKQLYVAKSVARMRCVSCCLFYVPVAKPVARTVWVVYRVVYFTGTSSCIGFVRLDRRKTSRYCICPGDTSDCRLGRQLYLEKPVACMLCILLFILLVLYGVIRLTLVGAVVLQLLRTVHHYGVCRYCGVVVR